MLNELVLAFFPNTVLNVAAHHCQIFSFDYILKHFSMDFKKYMSVCYIFHVGACVRLNCEHELSGVSGSQLWPGAASFPEPG